MTSFPDGPFDRTLARAAGFNDAVIGAAVADGRLRRACRGVYVASSRQDTQDLRAQSLALVIPYACAVARRAAAWLHGVDANAIGDRSEPSLEIVVPTGATPPRWPGIRAYAAPLGSADVEVVHGVKVTTPVRTAADLLRTLPRADALAAVDSMLHAGLVQASGIGAELTRWAGHRGVAQARELLGWAEPLTESPMESRSRLQLLDAGLPRPVAQHPVRLLDGRWVRLDLAYPERLLAVEFDGIEWHGPDRQRYDLTRRHALEALGWQVIVLTMEHVLGPAPRAGRVVLEAYLERPSLAA